MASEEFVKAHKLEHQAILIAAQSMTTDEDDSFQGSMRKMAGSYAAACSLSLLPSSPFDTAFLKAA